MVSNQGDKHEGKTLKQSDTPDPCIRHELKVCEHCQKSHAQVTVKKLIKRQVFDIPHPQVNITVHQAEVKVCPHCHHKSFARFSDNVKGPVQYEDTVKGMAVYLSQHQLLP